MSLYEDIELLTTQELLRLPPVKWLLHGIIPEEGYVTLYGAPEGGKSFVALDWAMSISEGKPWLGRVPVTQAPVIYVAAEGGRGITKRVRAWMRHHQVKDLPAMYFLLNPLYVRQEGTVEAFIDELESREIWPGLVVLDTLSRSFGGGEENTSADMGLFVDRMAELAIGRRMACLVLHHKNATGSRERGSTALRGAMDAMFDLDTKRDQDGKITLVAVRNDKQKDDTRTPPFYLRPANGTELLGSLVFEEAPEPPKKERGAGGPTVMRRIDMLTYLGGHPEGLTFSEWMLGCQVPKATFKRRIHFLIENGDIYREEGKYFVFPANIDLVTNTEASDE